MATPQNAQKLGLLCLVLLGFVAVFSRLLNQIGPAKTVTMKLTSGMNPDRTWISDDWKDGILWSAKITSTLLEVKSQFQKVQVVQSQELGRMLLLDEIIQCSESDERGYHEMIVHVPLCRKGASKHPKKRALIIGGGDGGAAREILRHDDISLVDHVEIDPVVIQAAKDFLPTIWAHPYNHDASGKPLPLDTDKRLNVMNLDAVDYLRANKSQERYDLIIVDASDPIGPGTALYTTEFYTLLRNSLRDGGAVSVQGGSFFWLSEVYNAVYHQLKTVFPVVKPYTCFTAVYPGGVWNLQIATLGDDPAQVDHDRAATIKVQPKTGLDWYTTETHAAAFALPPYAKRMLEAKPMTLAELSKLLST